MKWLPALLLLAACARTPEPSTPQDATLLRLGQAGGAAYDLERPDEAAEQYRAALARARERDDAAAIADIGFNLAVVQLRAGHPADAAKTARELRAELARRGIVDPAFELITATALFRQSDSAAADQVAAGLTAGQTPALADAAWFLRGLIADGRQDRPGLERAAAALGPGADPADIAELQARRTHDAAMALRSADLRRDALDYRGMSRTLALAASYTPDPTRAADLFLRAGRSAAAHGDTTEARAWLTEGRRRTPDAQLRSDADRALRDLPKR